MDADTPPWTLLYHIKTQAKWLPVARILKKRKEKLQSFSHNCMAVCDYDFSLESPGNQRKCVLCCAAAHTAATFLLIWECMAFSLNGNYEGNKRGI